MPLLNTTFILDNPDLIAGLADGRYTRWGGVIRRAKGTEGAGEIVKHLLEAPGATEALMNGIPSQLSGMSGMLSKVMGLTQIAAGASVINLGVSVIGFAYMGFKLHQIQKSLGDIQNQLSAGFQTVHTKLDGISNQLLYISLLVEDSRQKQESLAKAISNIQKTILIKEIANLNAELNTLKLFPNESPIAALKAATGARIFLSSQAMQSTPELEAELLLNTDISIRGWAVATATEANLLMNIGQHREARQMLLEETSKFSQVSRLWTNALIKDEEPSLSSAYRFKAKPLNNLIQPERVERIIDFSSVDCNLNQGQIFAKQMEIEAELEMSYAQEKYSENWIHQQVATVEYLDTLSELDARLDSLHSFAELCERTGVRSSKELLPDETSKAGLYLLSE